MESKQPHMTAVVQVTDAASTERMNAILADGQFEESESLTVGGMTVKKSKAGLIPTLAIRTPPTHV